MNKLKRHIDTGKSHAHFDNDFLIQCPRCREGAKISNGKLYCSHCGHHGYKAIADPESDEFIKYYSCRWNAEPWYGYKVAQTTQGNNHWDPKCLACNADLLFQVPARRFPEAFPQKMNIQCKKCGNEHAYDLSWQNIFCDTEPMDPVFGCDLLLVQSVKEGIVYAKNIEQLQELRKFVGAELRERVASPYWSNSSYFSRLPKWIKAAKNRDQILKACDKLLKKTETLT